MPDSNFPPVNNQEPLPRAVLASLNSGVEVTRAEPHLALSDEFEPGAVYRLWRDAGGAFVAWDCDPSDAGLWYSAFHFTDQGNRAQEVRRFIPWASLAGAEVLAVAPVLADHEPPF